MPISTPADFDAPDGRGPPQGGRRMGRSGQAASGAGGDFRRREPDGGGEGRAG